MGCQQGCKRSAMKTWLQDASDCGRAARGGLPRGADPGRRMAARPAWRPRSRTPTARSRALTVEAPTWWWPAARSSRRRCCCARGIGGPAVGKNLRLHPAYVVMGVYDEPVEGWRGQIQSLVSDAYDDLEDGYGFLIEATGMFPGLIARSSPGSDGADHKQLMQTLRWQAPFITVARDHGSGEVVLDDLGRAGGALGAGRRGRPPPAPSARTWSCAGCTRRRARRRSSPRTRASCAGDTGDDFEAFVRRGRGGVLRAERRGLLHGASDGLVPDGVGSGDVGGRRPRRAARHEGRVDRRRLGVPDGAGREPDGLDHVAGAPDGRSRCCLKQARRDPRWAGRGIDESSGVRLDIACCGSGKLSARGSTVPRQHAIGGAT